jgi:hypothetical protein
MCEPPWRLRSNARRIIRQEIARAAICVIRVRDSARRWAAGPGHAPGIGAKVTLAMMMMVADQPVAVVHSAMTAAAVASAAAVSALAACAARFAASFFAAAAPRAPAPMMTPESIQTAASAAGGQGNHANQCQYQALHIEFPFFAERRTESRVDRPLIPIGGKIGKIQQIATIGLSGHCGSLVYDWYESAFTQPVRTV